MQTNVIIENRVVAILSADPICAALPVRLVDGTDDVLPIVRAFRVTRLEHSAIVCFAPQGNPNTDRVNSGLKDWVLVVMVMTAFAEQSEPDAGQDSDADGNPDVPTNPLSPSDLEDRHSARFEAVLNMLQVDDLAAQLSAADNFHVHHVMFDMEEHEITESHLVSRLTFRLLGVAATNL